MIIIIYIYIFIIFIEINSEKEIGKNIRKLLSAAIEKRLMSDRRIGCLLSGGLDSSLVAALLVKHAKAHDLPYKIQSFSIGMENSPDVLAARQVADFLKTEHHEIIITQQDISEVLDKVIYQLETFDITTIRASIGYVDCRHYSIYYNNKIIILQLILIYLVRSSLLLILSLSFFQYVLDI